MKKIAKIVTLIMSLGMMGISNVANVSAMTVEKGIQWWTLEEMKETIAFMEGEAIKKCGDDWSCRKVKYQELINGDQRYSAANLASGKSLVISRINPGTSTMKIIYQGRTQLKLRSKPVEQSNLKEFYMMWVDPEMAEVTREEATLTSYLKSDGSIEGIHLLYQGGVDSGYLLAADQEMTIVAPSGSELINDSRGIISYTVKDDKGSGVWGSTVYGDCLKRDGYEVGVECEIMFSKSSFSYFPVVTSKSEDESGEKEEEKEKGEIEEKEEGEEEKGEDKKEEDEKEEDEKEEKGEEEEKEEEDKKEETSEEEEKKEEEGEEEEEKEEKIDEVVGGVEEKEEDKENEELDKPEEDGKLEEAKVSEGLGAVVEDEKNIVLVPETGHQNREGAVVEGWGAIIVSFLVIMMSKILKNLKKI